MIKRDASYIPNFLICTARGTGKTTSTIKLLEYFLYNQPFVVNVIKQTDRKLFAFINQIIQSVKADLRINVSYNQHRGEMGLGKTLIRGYTLNGDKLSVDKNPPTGLIIDAGATGIINIFDECAPDLKHELVDILIQSTKTNFFDEVPKMNLFMCNPWVSSNYYISKGNQALHGNRTKAIQSPYFDVKVQDGWCYIGASIFANQMCPKTDLQNYIETTKYSHRQRDIVLLGLPGALNGQVFDAFDKMSYDDFHNDFVRYVGGIDLGYTTSGGNGGATVMELFKYSFAGLSGVLEYYHHNKEVYVSSTSQQTYMLQKLADYLQKESITNANKMVILRVDVGADMNIATSFQQEGDRLFKNQVNMVVRFAPVTSGMKNKGKLKDRYNWINQCLADDFIHVSNKIQPHLFSDLENAVYKDTTIDIEKDPKMDHEYSDTIIGGLSYSVIGYAKSGLSFGKERKAKLIKQKALQKESEKSTSEKTS